MAPVSAALFKRTLSGVRHLGTSQNRRSVACSRKMYATPYVSRAFWLSELVKAPVHPESFLSPDHFFANPLEIQMNISAPAGAAREWVEADRRSALPSFISDSE